MNLVSAIDLFAGGEGSGCNPAVGACGRKSGHQTLIANGFVESSHPGEYTHPSGASASLTDSSWRVKSHSALGGIYGTDFAKLPSAVKVSLKRATPKSSRPFTSRDLKKSATPDSKGRYK